ncbi:MAG: hypothetical protein ACR2P1_21990, partial [Pseudomonadales bacterium]
FMAMEAFRAPLTVFPLLNQHLSSIGVPPPKDVSDWGAVTWIIWLLWLAIAIACIVIVTDLNEHKYGRNWSSVLRSAVLVWSATFGITWLSMFNLNLASADVLFVALPGSLIEVVVLCWVAQKWKHRPQ